MKGALIATTVFTAIALISLALCGAGKDFVVPSVIGLLVSIPGLAISLLILLIIAIKESLKK